MYTLWDIIHLYTYIYVYVQKQNLHLDELHATSDPVHQNVATTTTQSAQTFKPFKIDGFEFQPIRTHPPGDDSDPVLRRRFGPGFAKTRRFILTITSSA